MRMNEDGVEKRELVRELLSMRVDDLAFTRHGVSLKYFFSFAITLKILLLICWNITIGDNLSRIACIVPLEFENLKTSSFNFFTI
jgi:hypothetical protein